jgi:diguanylate cyclase (GGDEF)-like protein
MAPRSGSLIPSCLSGLRARLILLVAAAMLPVLALILYNTAVQHRLQQAEIERDVLRIVRLAATQQRDLLIRTRQLLASTAQLLASMSRQHTDDCRAMLTAVIKPLPYYINLGAADRYGAVYCSAADPGKPVSIGDRGYFREVLEKNDLAVGTYQIGRLTGRPTLAIGYPLQDRRQQQTDGVIFAALDLQWVNELLKVNRLPEGAALTVIDNSGTVLARQPEPERWVGQRFADAPLIRHMLSHSDSDILRLRGLDDVQRLYGHTTLIESGGGYVHLSLGVPEGVAYAPVYRSLVINLSILGLVALIALALAWWSAEILALRPLRSLTQAAGRVARGDLSTHLPLGRGANELNELSSHFNDMTDSLRLRETALSDTAQQLQRSNRALATLSAGNQAMLAATEDESLFMAICRIAVDTGGYRGAEIVEAEGDDDGAARTRTTAGQPLHDPALPACDRTSADTGPSVTRIPAGGHGEAVLCLSLPFHLDGQTGALRIWSNDADAFDADEIAILQETVHDMVFGLASLRDRQRARESAEHMEWLAYHDPLTGLDNRQACDLLLRERLAQHAPVTLLLLDVDRFREISDTLGHEAGDTLLIAITARLRAQLSDGARLARVGIDTFAILIDERDKLAAEEAARNLRQSLISQPFTVASLTLDVHASIGIAISPEDPIEPAHMMRRAILALRQAKVAITGLAHFDGTRETNHHRKLQLATDLRHAIDHDQLRLFCQPKLDLASRRIVSAEALARWPHPTLGAISPDEFIPLAEHTGLIRLLTEWAIERGAAFSHDWRESGLTVALAINLSAHNLHDPHLLPMIDGYMANWKLTTAQLEFEITESALMQNPEGARDTLLQLHERGFHLYIDDFGTGYSSLAYLQRLPVQAIKIDKSFVQHMTTDRDTAHIVRNSIALAHGLGMQVVAEGVEDEATLAALTAAGCDSAQGYHIARPFPAGELPAWIDRSAWKA